MAEKLNLKLPVLSKNKNINAFIYIAIFGIVAFAIYKIYIWYKNRNSIAPEQSISTIGTTPGTTIVPSNIAPEVSNDTILKKGSKNDRVQWVQNYYNKYVVPKNGGTKLVEDGVFGSKTEAAVFHVMGKKTVSWTEFKKRVDYNFPH